ncbi:MAG: hypothetical protein ABR574_13855, partial [Cryomorphaceae bacterium]
MGTSFSSKSTSKGDDSSDDVEDPLRNSAFNNTGAEEPGTGSGYETGVNDYYGDYVDFEVPWSLRM